METTEFWCNGNYISTYLIVVSLIALWSIPWKALALWRSARYSQKWWFIVFMLVNTVGLLEIFYLLILPKLKNKNK